MNAEHPNHYVTGRELDGNRILDLLDRAERMRLDRPGTGAGSLTGRSVALIFEKPSTRTRISFEVGVAELGGTPVVLRGDEMQLSRGESVPDTARVLSRFVHGIVIRSGSHQDVAELAANSGVPVVNALTPDSHPCQALADLLTLKQRFGRLDGLRVAYVGDGNNVAHSLAVAGSLTGVEVVIAAPEGYRPAVDTPAEFTEDAAAAVAGAHAIYGDVWVSMGDEDTAGQRRADLAPYRIDRELVEAARPDVAVMHCLPAHPGEEITAEVLYGEHSVVWDQAENRLHAQKALLELLIAGN